jgi:hypothetical protein
MSACAHGSSHASGFQERVKAENQQQNGEACDHAKTPDSLSGKLLIVLPQFHGNRNAGYGQKKKNQGNQKVEHLANPAEQASQERFRVGWHGLDRLWRWKRSNIPMVKPTLTDVNVQSGYAALTLPQRET